MDLRTDRGRFAIGAAVLTAAAVVSLPASGVSTRGGEWEPLAFTPYDTSCGDMIVHVSTSVNKEYSRETTLPDGTISFQVTGSLGVIYDADNGKSVSVNASGPGHLLIHPDTVVQVQAKGLNSYTFTEEQAQTLGVPQISVSAGPIDVRWHPDGTVEGHGQHHPRCLRRAELIGIGSPSRISEEGVAQSPEQKAIALATRSSADVLAPWNLAALWPPLASISSRA